MGSDDASDFGWIQELTWVELKKNIKSKQVLKYLKDGEALTTEEINEFRQKLNELQKQLTDHSTEQWEAFHVDYYYEAILQNNRNILQRQVQQNELEYSDDDEDEEQKA